MKNIIIKLKKIPILKKTIKFIYQIIGIIISDRKTIPDTIERVSDINKESLFGYYDKSPWNYDDSKFIYLKTQKANKNAGGYSKADIILVDFSKGTKEKISETSTWNSQQGSMLQWLGPKFDDQIIFNDFRNNKFVSIIFDINNKTEKIISNPIYSVDSRGENYFSLDFTRLNTLRPGYGYNNLKDNSKKLKMPNGCAILHGNLISDSNECLITYEEIYSLGEQDKNFKNSYHKVNHIMANKKGNIVIFIHRWILKGNKTDRLIAYFLDTNESRIILDDGMVSHSNWISETKIITFSRTKKYGDGYYIIDLINGKIEYLHNFPKRDGHPSLSPNKKYIIIDTYPDINRKQKVIFYNIEKKKFYEIASVYSNSRYLNNTRCDLHPRWNSNSNEICFDSSKDKYRGVYTIKIPEEYL